jgi:kumamolisin
MPPIHSYLKRRSHIHSYLKRTAAHRRDHRAAPPPPAISWTIPALCSAYNWPAGTAVGSGLIAIVELGGGWNTSDVAAAFQAMGQPIPTITDVSVDGTTNSPGSDADGEVALDIQVSGASYFCATGKSATIRMYWSQDIASAVTKAAEDGCDVCSISWGASESVWGQASLNAMEAAAAAATATGMVIFAASGDNSADDGGGATAVDAPASCPHVIGCGGTTKPATGTEMVWGGANPDGNGTGGGYSANFGVQAWQLGIPSAPTGLGRMVPDVAADADPNTGYDIVLDGQVQVFGGTSAVAPLYAGLVAAAGTKLGFISPTLWKNAAAFNENIPGTNGVYSQPPCPGPCSGLGSPIGEAVAALFEGSAPPTV